MNYAERSEGFGGGFGTVSGMAAAWSGATTTTIAAGSSEVPSVRAEVEPEDAPHEPSHTNMTHIARHGSAAIASGINNTHRRTTAVATQTTQRFICVDYSTPQYQRGSPDRSARGLPSTFDTTPRSPYVNVLRHTPGKLR